MDENCRGYSIVNDYNINYWCDFSLINKILILTKKKWGFIFLYGIKLYICKNKNH